jgi:hypothetical protein
MSEIIKEADHGENGRCRVTIVTGDNFMQDRLLDNASDIV